MKRYKSMLKKCEKKKQEMKIIGYFNLRKNENGMRLILL